MFDMLTMSPACCAAVRIGSKISLYTASWMVVGEDWVETSRPIMRREEERACWSSLLHWSVRDWIFSSLMANSALMAAFSRTRDFTAMSSDFTVVSMDAIVPQSRSSLA